MPCGRRWEWKNSSTHSEPRHYLEVNEQLHLEDIFISFYGENTRGTMEIRLGRTQSQSGCCGGEKYLFAVPRIEPQYLLVQYRYSDAQHKS